jgi:hypothetical protein
MCDIKVEVFQAKWGESILVTLFDKPKNKHIMIDMGFVDTYETQIRKRLKEISKEGILDLLVFTHIDSDHIAGGIKFLQENYKASSPSIIRVGEIWYNGLRHIIPMEERSTSSLDVKSSVKLKTKLIRGMEVSTSIKDEPISGKQGTVLGGLILNGGYNWNSSFYNKAIHTDAEKEENLEGVNIRLLSPNIKDLKMLEEEWKEELEDIGLYKVTKDNVFDDAFEVLLYKKFEKYFVPKNKPICSEDTDLSKFLDEFDYKDDSLKNASSISFVLEFNKKRLLFLGDSQVERILNSLTSIYTKEEFPLYFDLIKVSHHGSCGNTNIDLMNLIDSHKYIISTNGDQYNHPDRQVISQIVCRPTKANRKLYFNYENICNKYNNPAFMDKYKYEVNKIIDGKVEILIEKVPEC